MENHSNWVKWDLGPESVALITRDFSPRYDVILSAWAYYLYSLIKVYVEFYHQAPQRIELKMAHIHWNQITPNSMVLFPMEKGTKHLVVRVCPFPLLNHDKLYRAGCLLHMAASTYQWHEKRSHSRNFHCLYLDDTHGFILWEIEASGTVYNQIGKKKPSRKDSGKAKVYSRRKEK